MTRIILRNICANWTGFAVRAIVVFFLTPFVLRHLGDARYGVWVLSMSITGYYGLLTFGLRPAVTQYLTRYIASRDFVRMNQSVSTGFTVLTRVAGALVAISILLTWLAPYLFKVRPDLASELSFCILIVGCSMAFQIAIFPFSTVLEATQRFDVSNLIAIPLKLVYAILIWVVLTLGHGLVAVCLVTAAVEALELLVRWRVAYRLLPQLEAPKRLIHRECFRELLSFSSWSFLSALAESVRLQADVLVIGFFMPVAAIAPYALAANLRRYMSGLLQPVQRVFSPLAASLDARGSMYELRTMYAVGSRLLLGLLTVISVIAAIWSEDFFQLWVGQKYVDGKDCTSVALLFHLLLISLVARNIPGLGSQTLVGSLRIKPVAISAIAEAACSVVLSVVFIQYWGLVGIAVAAIVSAVLFRALVIPALVAHYCGVSVVFYFFHACCRPAILGLVLAPLAVQLHGLWTPRHFVDFALQVAMAGLIACPLFVIVAMTRSDRARLLYNPIKSFVAARRHKRQSQLKVSQVHPTSE